MPTWYKSQANKITISRVKANYLPSLFLYTFNLGYTLGTPWVEYVKSVTKV